jgi:hypothetical protein
MICAGFVCAGDEVHRADVKRSVKPVNAVVAPASRRRGHDGPSRIRGARTFFRERTSGTLTDEILMP